MNNLFKFQVLFCWIFFICNQTCFAQTEVGLHYGRAIELAIAGKYMNANQEIEKVLKIDPFYSPAREISAFFKDVLENRVKKEAAKHYMKGITYANQKRRDKSIEEHTLALISDPNYARTYVSRGSSYYNMGKIKLALKDFDAAIKLNGSLSSAFYNRGLLLARNKKRLDQAIEDFTTAIKLEPKDPMAYVNRGNSYNLKGQNVSAFNDYNKAIELNPKSFGGYYGRGRIYDQKGEVNMAVEDYSKAIEINPDRSEPYTNRGLIYILKLNNRERACRDLKKACELGACRNYDYAKSQNMCD